jgi:transcription elongation factor GreA
MKTPERQFNNINAEYISKEGLEKLRKELDELKTIRRRKIAERLEYAKSLGDLTENAEYYNAKEAQIINETRIAEIEDILSRAVIISKEDSNYIQPGSTIFLKKEGANETEKYSIVGPEEADSLKGKISYESPLGNALIGKKKSETIEVLTPKGKINYTIINVE